MNLDLQIKETNYKYVIRCSSVFLVNWQIRKINYRVVISNTDFKIIKTL
jgi:hypothetical protein